MLAQNISNSRNLISQNYVQYISAKNGAPKNRRHIAGRERRVARVASKVTSAPATMHHPSESPRYDNPGAITPHYYYLFTIKTTTYIISLGTIFV